MILDSAAAIRRARAALGQPDGLGMCLLHNWQWWGSVQSIGPGAGDYDVALKGWNYSPEKTYPIELAPAGVPVWFGVSPTRTDHNKAAGDVGLSIGGGLGIFTDGPSGNTSIMSFGARGLQIARPPLGFTTDFLGHDTTAGLAWLGSTTGKAIIVTTSKTQENTDMSLRIVKDDQSNALNLVNLDTGVRKSIDDIDDARDLGILINGTGRLSPRRIDVLNSQFLRPIGPIGAANVVASAGKG